MAIWALADLHLSFGIPDKEMDVFGPAWTKHSEKIRAHWMELVSEDDLVLIAGDISWATHIEGALVDLQWIDALPGTKVMIRGNHDYWWHSLKKLEKIAPPSIHFIQNNIFLWNGIAIGGARLWDTREYSFGSFIEYKENKRATKVAENVSEEEHAAEDERIFVRELSRLELSLKCFPENVKTRIVMTHYPPIGADLKDSRASAILEKYKVNTCVFGHLHNVRSGSLPFGTKAGVAYYLTACDYLGFVPLKLPV